MCRPFLCLATLSGCVQPVRTDVGHAPTCDENDVINSVDPSAPITADFSVDEMVQWLDGLELDLRYEDNPLGLEGDHTEMDAMYLGMAQERQRDAPPAGAVDPLTPDGECLNGTLVSAEIGFSFTTTGADGAVLKWNPIGFVQARSLQPYEAVFMTKRSYQKEDASDDLLNTVDALLEPDEVWQDEATIVFYGTPGWSDWAGIDVLTETSYTSILQVSWGTLPEDLE